MQTADSSYKANPAKQCGAAIVEYVIVLPIVLLLMLATAEFGRAFLQFNALNKTLRDGARFAAEVAVISSGTTGIVSLAPADRDDVRRLVAFGNTAGTGSPVLPGLAINNITVVGGNDGDIDLTANYAYQSIFARIPQFGFGPDIIPQFTLQASVTMRAL